MFLVIYPIRYRQSHLTLYDNSKNRLFHSRLEKPFRYKKILNQRPVSLDLVQSGEIKSWVYESVEYPSTPVRVRSFTEYKF